MQSADFLSAVFFYLKEGENLNQNWIVENLNNAFSTWNGKLGELWGLVTTGPQTFKGGAVWSVMQTLESPAPDLAGQCHADLMALLRGDFPLAEALVGVERHHAVCFTKAFLYSPHILPRMVCPAMDAGDKLGALVQLGLGIVLCVVQCLGKGIVFGFVRIGCVIKDAL